MIIDGDRRRSSRAWVEKVSKHHPAIAAAVVLSAAHFASFLDADQKIVTDIRYFLYFAWRITEGAVPHLDLFDNKTFLASFTGALFYELGTRLDVDPLMAIRAGFLAVCAAGGLLVFIIHRRLSGNSQVGGFLGLFAYLGFGLIGALPAIGNVPKLLMAVLASAMGLLVHDRRWFLAGVAGALAFMDWQIGVLVWLSAFACALLSGAGWRRAGARVVAGGAAGLAPFLAYYALNGALEVTFRQVVLASLYRASNSMAQGGILDRMAHITRQWQKSCTGHEWLFLTGLVGLVVVPLWLWTRRRSDERRLLLPLTFYHFGVVLFSLVDFQGHGDFYVLVHSVAFFLGVTWLALYAAARKVVLGATGGGTRARAVLALVVLVAAGGASRPTLLRPEIQIFTPRAPIGVTLADQKEVAAKLRKRTRSQRLVLLGYSELLFLMRHTNPLPNIYWNPAAYDFYGRVGEETYQDAAARVLLSADPDAFIYTRRVKPTAELTRSFSASAISSRSGLYRVRLFTRRRPPG